MKRFCYGSVAALLVPTCALAADCDVDNVTDCGDAFVKALVRKVRAGTGRVHVWATPYVARTGRCTPCRTDGRAAHRLAGTSIPNAVALRMPVSSIRCPRAAARANARTPP